ncbi:MAG: response regulator [Verrucomicrobiota bacterium]
MKKKILFVDDEQFVLDGMKRSMRKMRGQWETDFANSGHAALEKISSSHYDIIVSDMRMPKMNGAQLLQEVKRRDPQTIRFMLSGYSDQDLILQSLNATHQFLNKPCNPTHLMEAMARAEDIEQFLGNKELESLLKGMNRVPSIPSLYRAVNEKLDEPSCDLQEIAELIKQDPGSTAKILSIVNSAFFGNPQKMVDPLEAIQYLGLEIVKSLLLSSQIFSQFEEVEKRGFPIDSLCNQSLKTAHLASKIAAFEKAEKKTIDEAFTGGLLHDIGQLILYFNFPDTYNEIFEKTKNGQVSLSDLEEELIGSSHAEVGSFLLGLWGLPLPIIDAIRMHHSPNLSSDLKFSALTAVHVASAEMKEESLKTTEDKVDLEYLKKLGLDDHLPDWIELINNNQGDF